MIGKDPKGFAASAIYIVSKHTKYRKTQEQISKVAKISEVTLRSRAKDLRKNLASYSTTLMK